MDDLTFLMSWRDSLLQLLDVIERRMIAQGARLTRTAELRKEAKRVTMQAQTFEHAPIVATQGLRYAEHGE